MSKLVIINMGGHGHVNPTLALTQELVRRGHDVTYAVTDDFAAAVAATGAKYKGYDSLWRQAPPPPAGADFSAQVALLPVRFLKECLHSMPQLIDWLRAEQPDAILYDSMAISGRLLAEALGIPAVALFASYASNSVFSLGKEFGMSQPAPEIEAEFNQLGAELAATYGIKAPTVASLFQHSEPLNLVFLPRAFQISGDSFDDRFVFCGPQITSRPTAGSWQRASGEGTAAGERPLLYISLGTVFSNWPEFFNMCFKAFGDKEVDVVMSVSARVDQTKLDPAPANFTVAPFFPQLEILAQADVFVSHGGMNSTMEALYFGVPLVVVPQMPEQAVSARRIAELGLGLTYDRAQLSVDVLANEVLPLATNATVRSKMKKMQADLQGSGGAVLAAASVERYIGGSTQQPTATRSTADTTERSPETL